MQKIKLRVDSRNKRWSVAKTFGQVTDFPSEFSIKETLPDYVQPLGDVRCTAITCCDIGSDKDEIQYDIDDLFNRIPHDQNGAVPQDALGETVKGGLLPKGQIQRITPFSSYYEAHSGSLDAFDSVRSALMVCKYPVAVFTRWYEEWLNVTDLPIGKTAISGHMYDVDGWTVRNGETKLIVSAWLGYNLYMSREVFNKAVSAWGCGTAVLSTFKQDIDRKKTLIEAIKDTMMNILLWIQDQIKVDNSPIQSSSNDIIKPMETKKSLYDIAFSNIGQRIFIKDVGATYGCAQALSYVLKEYGSPIPAEGISSTIEMDKWLQNNATPVSTPDAGDIIISVTQGNNHGHCGVVGKNAIMSNDSQTGEWQPYWSLSAWLNYYKGQKGLLTKFYRL